jgi:glycerophosphoryl diester phosphodiesterase
MIVIGHRGARGLGLENTLAAFSEALAAGADEVELDVRVTKDGICVLNHDPFLHDMSGGKMRDIIIADLLMDDLREYRADLITLDDVISFVDRRVPIIVEIKPGVPVGPVVTIIDEFLQKGWQLSDFRLASFSQRTLKELHKALPGIEKIVNERFGGVRATWRARQVNTKRLAFNHHNMWWGFIRAMHRKGWQISAYTLNDVAKANRWKQYGLYGVVTDFPDRFTKK